MLRVSRLLLQNSNKPIKILHSDPTKSVLSESTPETWKTDQVIKTRGGSEFHTVERPYKKALNFGILFIGLMGMGYSYLVHREKTMSAETKLKFAVEAEDRVLKDRETSEEDILAALKAELNTAKDKEGCPYK